MKYVKLIGIIGLMAFSVIAGFVGYQYTKADFVTTDGSTYQWQELEGNWVIINYFAPWCVPCLREMPELHEFDRALPANTKLFAINYDALSHSDLVAMLAAHKITLKVIEANEDTLLPMAKPNYLPATFIIGPDGRVRDTIMGEVTASSLTQRLAQLKAL